TAPECAEVTCRRADLGQALDRNAERLAQFPIPPEIAQVHQTGSRGRRGIGGADTRQPVHNLCRTAGSAELSGRRITARSMSSAARHSSTTARPTSAIRRRSLLSSVPSYGWRRDAEARRDYLRCSDGREHLTSKSQRRWRPPQKI